MRGWIITILAVVASSVSLSSCQDENDNEGKLNSRVPLEFLLYDGGGLDTIVGFGINSNFDTQKGSFEPEVLKETYIRLYCLILPRNNEGDVIPCAGIEYDGQNFTGCFGNDYSGIYYNLGTSQMGLWELPEANLYRKTMGGKSEFIKEGMSAAGYGDDYGYMGTYPEYFYTAYIDEDVVISCDKPLFDKAPGENLLNYFEVAPSTRNMVVGQMTPEFVGGFNPHRKWFNAQDIFVAESWLSLMYEFRFKDEPPQEYEEVTFNITLPVIREHLYDKVMAEYYGLDDYVDFDRKILTTQTTIRLNR